MDGRIRVDVPWHVDKFFTDKAKGYKKKSPIMGAHLIGRIARSYGLITQGSLRNDTLGPEILLLNVAKLVDLGIYRYNGLGYDDLVDDIPENGEDEGAADASDNDAGGVRCRLNMSFTNRLRVMDERLGEMKTDISRLGSDVDDLTYVVSRMSEQYDQFYGEFGQMRVEQERFQTWNTDYLSQPLSHHHIAHTRYDETHYSYVLNIPDVGVQQGVNFMSSTPENGSKIGTYCNVYYLDHGRPFGIITFDTVYLKWGDMRRKLLINTNLIKELSKSFVLKLRTIISSNTLDLKLKIHLGFLDERNYHIRSFIFRMKKEYPCVP
nr:hypothetical protein [Tanacetum cinerariifolium]